MQHEPVSFDLLELFKLVAGGRMALPQFQRDFVWDPNRVVELLDSIANGWPIGSLLLLEGPQPFGLKEMAFGPPADRSEVKYYLLDGQQRVTSLFHVLGDRGDAVYFVNLSEASHSDERRFRWAKRDRYEGTQRPPGEYKISDIWNGASFERLTSELPSAKSVQLNHERDVRLGHLLDPSYRVPGILMRQNIELEALTRIFETLNRTGVRLDAFDLMVAVLYPRGFLLRDAWEAAVAAEPLLDEMEVSGLEILKFIALLARDADRSDPIGPTARRVTGIRQKDILNVPASYVEERWESSVAAYVHALRFLRARTGMYDSDSVPSTAMVLTVTYLLAHGASDDFVETWYWESIAAQEYAQGANTQVLTDVDRWRDGAARLERDFKRLRASMLDPVRRNKILRLGLRGRAVTVGARDPWTGFPLSGPTREVPVRSFWEGRLVPGNEHPLVDMIFCSAESLLALRRSSPLYLDGATRHPDALSSQGLSEEWLVGKPSEGARIARADFLAGWLT